MIKGKTIGIVAAVLAVVVLSAVAVTAADIGTKNCPCKRGDWAPTEEMRAHREEVKTAIEAGDYEAWKAAVEDSPRGGKMVEFVTEENFSTFLEMHEAKQARDFETVKELKAELGFPEKGMRGHRFRAQ